MCSSAVPQVMRNPLSFLTWKWAAICTCASLAICNGSDLPVVQRARGRFRTDLPQDSHIEQLDHERRLAIALYGQWVQLSRWTCSDECSPAHEEQAINISTNTTTLGNQSESSCTERRNMGLTVEDTIDLKCTGSSLTCNDIENNATWTNRKEVMFSNCNQDPDLLYGECEYYCAHGLYPRKRCTSQYDRINKYGMGGSNGVFDYHFCFLVTGCPENQTAEDKQLICNVTEMHDLYSAPATTTSTAVPAPTTTATTMQPKVIEKIVTVKEDGDSMSPVVPALLGGAFVGLLATIAALVYFKLCKKQSASNSSFGGVQAGQPRSPDEGSTVVVGRPIGGATPPTSGEKGKDTADAECGKEVDM